MPITEPTDTIEMLVTATTRRLATSTGIGKRQFDFQHPGQRLVADGGGRVEHCGRHRVQRLGHRTHQQRDGVQRQRDDDVGLVEDPRRDDQRQHDEQRQRRDGEDDARGDRGEPAQHRRALHERAERHGDQQPEHHRNQRQPQVDQRQRPGLVEVGEQIAHRLPQLRDAPLLVERVEHVVGPHAADHLAVVVDRHPEPRR